MGLDITAYSYLEHTGITDYDSDLLDDNDEYVYVENSDFPERLDDTFSGVYRTTDDTEEFGFGAGAYSGYNLWRRQLCEAVHGVPPEVLWNDEDGYKGKAFYELIHMSDCEGAIGTAVCKKLFNDFRTHENELRKVADEYFQRKLDDWMTAFRIGSENGIVDFH